MLCWLRAQACSGRQSQTMWRFAGLVALLKSLAELPQLWRLLDAMRNK